MNRATRLAIFATFPLLLAPCGPASVDAPSESVPPSFTGGNPDVGPNAGAWEGVAFDPGQVAVTLDLVANADVQTLDVDAALDSRAAQAIVAARPHTMSALAATSWVGGSALTKI